MPYSKKVAKISRHPIFNLKNETNLRQQILQTTFTKRDNCTHYRGITTAVVYIHPRRFSLHNMDLYFCSKSFIFGSLLETHPRNFQILQSILLDRRRIYICCLDVPHCGAFYSMPPLWNAWRQVLCSCVQQTGFRGSNGQVSLLYEQQNVTHKIIIPRPLG